MVKKIFLYRKGKIKISSTILSLFMEGELRDGRSEARLIYRRVVLIHVICRYSGDYNII